MTIRPLIREFLLQEEVFGAQAFVYHGSKTPPKTLLQVLLQNKFEPGKGQGGLYGKGLYAVYDLEDSRTLGGFYGRYLYKLKVNLYGFISFDPEITRKIYKRDLTPVEQAKEAGVDKKIIEKLKAFDINTSQKFTSNDALKVSSILRNEVKGLVYTGENDGRCVVIYDASIVVPVAYRDIGDPDERWYDVPRHAIKPALRRSSTGDWEKEKYEIPRIIEFERLSRLPVEKRIMNHNLYYKPGSIIDDIPDGIKINGKFEAEGCQFKKFPKNIVVRDVVNLTDSKIDVIDGLVTRQSLILDTANVRSIQGEIKVGGNFSASNSTITSLPSGMQIEGLINVEYSTIETLPDGLELNYSLELLRTNVRSLPAGLKVAGNLCCSNLMEYIPDDIKIGGDLDLGEKIKSLPDNLSIGGTLSLNNSGVTFLPSGLKIGGELRLGLHQGGLAILPNDLQVKSVIRGHRLNINYVPIHLRSKIK